MLPENELLQYVHKTADMGCGGIESVLNYAGGGDLRRALQQQLSEYQELRSEAASLLEQRGEDPSDAGVVAKVSADLMSAGKLILDGSDSQIAEMTIEGNNMGVSKTLRHLHDYEGRDPAVRDLTQKLLATERANVEQLQAFL